MNRQIFFITVLLLISLGCAVPSFSAPAAESPAAASPTLDERLPTLVADMVNAAMTQTVEALPTSTFTPAPTSTPAPTFTPTSTPPVGSSFSAQEDSSTLFTDERGGYTLTIPEGWLAVRVNQQEFFDALTIAEETNPLLYETLKKAADEDQSVLRLFAVDTQDEMVEGQPVTTIQLILDEAQEISFDSDKDLQAIADGLAKSATGMEVTALDILVTPGGAQFGIIESETKASDGMLTFEKRVYFQAKTGMAYAWLTTGENLKETIIPAFDAIMDTLRVE